MTELPADAVSADSLVPLPSAQPVPLTVYAIVSWYAPEHRWKLWSGLYADRQCANDFAQRLPDGHTHYCILEIRLPGV